MRVGLSVEELHIPASIDGADAADFVAALTLLAALQTAGYDTDEFIETPLASLPSWQDEHSPRRLFGVRVDGELAGTATYETKPGSTTAWLFVGVLPRYRGRGIGTALADRLDDLATDESRETALVYTVSPEAPGLRVTAATGIGSVPRDNPEVRFLADRGYRLEQVKRVGRLALPIDEAVLQARLDALLGDRYAVETWVDSTPVPRLDDVASLRTLMAADAPRVGRVDDTWTAPRLREWESRMAASPTAQLYAAVADRTGLVGLTVLFAPAENDRAGHQDLTVVLAEHRGRGLGTALKLANLLHLQREYPGHPSVVTFNAEENRAMLAVNEAAGFVPLGREGVWRRDAPPGA